MKFWIAMLLLVCLVATGLAGAETLDVLEVILPDDFAQTHPEVEVRHGDGADYVFDTNVLMGRLLTKEFRYDIFEVDTGSIDVRQMMRKGYCLDLSQSEILQRPWRGCGRTSRRRACWTENFTPSRSNRI